MHTIETKALVTSDHQLVIQSPVPKDVAPGEHLVSVTIDPTADGARDLPLFRSSYAIGLTGDDFTFRREDIYDDAGR